MKKIEKMLIQILKKKSEGKTEIGRKWCGSWTKPVHNFLNHLELIDFSRFQTYHELKL